MKLMKQTPNHLLSQFETNTIHLALLRTPFHTDSLTCKKLFTDSLVAVGQESFFADNRSFCHYA